MATKKQEPSSGNKKTKPAPRPHKKSERQLRVEFTNDEMLGLAKKLAEANADLVRAEDEKKAVTSQLKSKCDAIVAKVGELSGKINCGFEYRNIQVETRFDDPKPGMKTTYRLDTDAIVECEAMTMQEMQIELPLGDKVVSIKTGKPERAPIRTVTGSGVVATEEDGKGENLANEDDEKT